MPYKRVTNAGKYPLIITLHVRKTAEVHPHEASYEDVQAELNVGEEQVISYADEQHPYLSGFTIETKAGNPYEPSFIARWDVRKRGDSIDDELNTTDSLFLGFRTQQDEILPEEVLERVGLEAFFNSHRVHCTSRGTPCLAVG
jgi:hypothetical protein